MVRAVSHLLWLGLRLEIRLIALAMALGLTERGEIEQRLGADLSENTLEDGIEGASARFDRALGRLEASLRSLNARMRAQARIDVDTQKLVVERARLAADLDKASAKARRLDDSAHEVSVRLVEAMETVRAVLTK